MSTERSPHRAASLGEAAAREREVERAAERISERIPESPFKSRSGIERVSRALGHSLSGLAQAYRAEAAFRQELALCALLAPVALLVPVPPLHKLALIGVLVLVLVVELLNSAVEAAVDRVSLDRHDLSRRAKDIGSAAVLLSLLLAAATWITLLLPLLVRE